MMNLMEDYNPFRILEKNPELDEAIRLDIEKQKLIRELLQKLSNEEKS